MEKLTSINNANEEFNYTQNLENIINEKRKYNLREKEFGKKIPLHITRFFPRFKFADCDPTPVSKIRRLVDVAKERLEFVFAGNV